MDPWVLPASLLAHTVAAGTNTINLLAGTPGVEGFNDNPAPGNSTSALSALFNIIEIISKDAQGNIYIKDAYGLYRLSANFATVTNVPLGDYNDRGAWGIALLANGTILLSRRGYSIICRYNGPNNCTTVAGMFRQEGFSGDGGPATSATLNLPTRIVAHPTDPNKFYINDRDNFRIRMVSNGIITTVAGTGQVNFGTPQGDGGPATSAPLDRPFALDIDAAGNLYICEEGHRVRWAGDAEQRGK
jgi:hypothetical protein